MASKELTKEKLRAHADRLRRKEKALEKAKDSKLTTFSHFVMAGIMVMFFLGAILGGYVTVFKDEPVSTTLDYIMKLAFTVSLGYFVKAFGENIAKIVISAVFGTRKTDETVPVTSTVDDSNSEQGGLG